MKFGYHEQYSPKTESDIQQHYKQIIFNLPKLPLPKSQLLQIYDNYLQLNDRIKCSDKLLLLVMKTNDEAILKEFLAFMNKLFDGLDSEFEKINSTASSQRLSHLIRSNFPSFVTDAREGNQSQKKAEMSMERAKLQSTPMGQEQKDFQSQQQKVDFIFAYLFQQIHFLILRYKNYYEMDNVDSLENAVCESFSSYVDQNMSLFFPQKMEQQEKQNIVENTNAQKVQGQKIGQKQQKQKEKSAFVNNLIDVVIENASDANIIRKIGQNQINQRQSLKISNYQIKPYKILNKGKTFLQGLYTQGLTKTIASVYHYARDMSIKSAVKYEVDEKEEEMVMKLADTILKSHIRHNVNQQSGLQADQFRMVEEFINEPKETHFDNLVSLFTKKEKQAITEILRSVVNDLESPGKVHLPNVIDKLRIFAEVFSNLQVKSQKSSIKTSSKKGIKTTLSIVNTISELPNTFYLLSNLFREFQNDYCPHTRRIMLRICHAIEEKSKDLIKQEGEQYRRFCLVHALKLLQCHNIKRSEVCNIITNQKPFRQSHLPLKNQKSQYFEENDMKNQYSSDQAQKHLQLELNRLHIFELQKDHKDMAKMQLLKLSHATNKKTITILVSGFLSEDTNKFQEWMGVLEPTYDSQIYALKWESKTIEHILQFTINTCKDIALTGAGIGFIGGPYIKAALVIKEILKKYHQNPFMPCFQVATLTGIYFADLLMSLFDGHFINLVGFSLGTQVIASALEQFKKRGKLHMINRFVTLGGVADRLYLSEILDTVQQSEEKPISIAWTNVYCQTDNILRYLLRISMPSLEPIGLIEIKQEDKAKLNKVSEKQESQIKTNKGKIYEVDNINVTQFVNGHLSYRPNMKNIARLLGIKDE